MHERVKYSIFFNFTVIPSKFLWVDTRLCLLIDMFTFGHFIFLVVQHFEIFHSSAIQAKKKERKKKKKCVHKLRISTMVVFLLFGEHTLGIQFKKAWNYTDRRHCWKKKKQFSIVIWATLFKCLSSRLTWCGIKKNRMWSVETWIWSELFLFRYIKWLILLWSVSHFKFAAMNLLLVCLKSHSRGHPNLTISQSNATRSNVFPSTLNYLSLG